MEKTKLTTIIKASGERNVFSAEKLKKSLLRAGASSETIESILGKTISELYDGISTREIYQKAFKMLKKSRSGIAAKYKLKNAIMELGPSGFPFEQFIARLFTSMGYKTQTGQIIKGTCVSHEVDIVAKMGEKQQMIECKFHQQKGIVCDVKIPLYIRARFWDIENELNKLHQKKDISLQSWLVTNTRFSSDALSYGLCSGLKLLGWDYPEKDSLKDLIDRYGLHPVTCLTTITKYEKQQLLDKNIVLCSEIKTHLETVNHIVKKIRLEKVLIECDHLTFQDRTRNTILS